MGFPGIDDIRGSELYAISQSHWLTKKKKKSGKDPVATIFSHVESTGFARRELLILESLEALELYFYPNVTEKVPDQFVILTILVINVKMLRGQEVWQLLESSPDKLGEIFSRALRIVTETEEPIVAAQLMTFLTALFSRLTSPHVRALVGPIVSITIWSQLSSELARDRVIAADASLAKSWKRAQKKLKADKESAGAAWLHSLIARVSQLILDKAPLAENLKTDSGKQEARLWRAFIETAIVFFITLLSQLPTRRYSNTLIKDSGLLPLLSLNNSQSGTVADFLVQKLEWLIYFPIDDFTGNPLTEADQWKLHENTIHKLQGIAFSEKFKQKLHLLALANFDSIRDRGELQDHLSELTTVELTELVTVFGLNPVPPVESINEREFAFERIAIECAWRGGKWRELVPFPTEKTLFSDVIERILELDNIEETEAGRSGPEVGLLPVLSPSRSRQFLSQSHFVAESAQATELSETLKLRLDIEAIIARINPRVLITRKRRADGDEELEVEKVTFTGQSKRAARIVSELVPLSGIPIATALSYPEEVETEFIVDFESNTGAQTDWQSLVPGDVIHLVQFGPQKAETSWQQYGIARLQAVTLKSFRRDASASGRLRLVVGIVPGAAKVRYNAVLRPATDSTFAKSILAHTHDLLHQLDSAEGFGVVPHWLSDILMGFGTPTSSTFGAEDYSFEPLSVDYLDTFADLSHLKETIADANEAKSKLTLQQDGAKIFISSSEYGQPVTRIDRAQKSVRLAPSQVRAVISGVNSGLTLVQGASGSGKTTAIAQILSVLANSDTSDFSHKTLVIARTQDELTRFTSALRDTLIMTGAIVQIPSNLRASITSADNPAVKTLWERRGALLKEVDLLAETIDAPGAHGDSCETAEYFYRSQVADLGDDELATFLERTSIKFRSSTGGRGGASAGLEKVEEIFRELRQIRPLEFLRSPESKLHYLLTEGSQVVAVTLSELITSYSYFKQLNLKFDTAIVLGGSQLSDGAVIAALGVQQQPQFLTRLIIGGDDDHGQRVFDRSGIFRDYEAASFVQGELDPFGATQSIFGRLAAVGVPTRDVSLGALNPINPQIESVISGTRGTAEGPDIVNGGLRFSCQVINVEDYSGQGQFNPAPGVVQNLDEANYAVLLYQYLRLLGYDKDDVAIVTATRGQRLLIQEILDQKLRVSANDLSLFGRPAAIETIDEISPQRRRVIIGSTVYTDSPVHFRGERSLIATMARRALHGLYIVGRMAVLQEVQEFKSALKVLSRSDHDNLVVIPGEMDGSPLTPAARESAGVEMTNVEHLRLYVDQMRSTRIQFELDPGQAPEKQPKTNLNNVEINPPAQID